MFLGKHKLLAAQRRGQLQWLSRRSVKFSACLLMSQCSHCRAKGGISAPHYANLFHVGTICHHPVEIYRKRGDLLVDVVLGPSHAGSAGALFSIRRCRSPFYAYFYFAFCLGALNRVIRTNRIPDSSQLNLKYYLPWSGGSLMSVSDTVEFDTKLLINLIDQYKSDRESVYNTWFTGGEERLKAFRAIRIGVRDTFTAIAAGTFGNDFKDSALEVVLTAITEQKQVFVGAAHAFYWKPKLRIPDIYENPDNKRKFGEFLESCYSATREDQVLDQMSRLATAEIKGLGPATANIIYFLHPTFVLPFNTAIVNGFNSLFSDKIKLGSWQSYFAMREACVRLNSHGEIRGKLSKDLGAIAGLLFEIGSGRLLVDGNISTVLANENEKARKASKARHQEVVNEQNEESEHTRIQYILVKIGRALKFDVYVARNDRHKTCDGESLAQLTIPELLPASVPIDAADSISLIDVLWLKRETGEIVSAFEVEKSTSIYSGILRMEDLARSIPDCRCALYLVAPDNREKEVLAQLKRPSFRRSLADVSLSYIPFSELVKHCEGLMKFGEDHTIMSKVSRHCTCSSV